MLKSIQIDDTKGMLSMAGQVKEVSRGVSVWKLAVERGVLAHAGLSDSGKAVLSAMVRSASLQADGRLVFAQSPTAFAFSLDMNLRDVREVWGALQGAGYIQRCRAAKPRREAYQIYSSDFTHESPF